MNVLIALGATAAFVYSLVGTVLELGSRIIYFMKQLLPSSHWFLWVIIWKMHRYQSTQKALNTLAKSQKVMANMIAFDDKHQEIIFPIENTN